jgi:hypothetical protein
MEVRILIFLCCLFLISCHSDEKSTSRSVTENVKDSVEDKKEIKEQVNYKMEGVESKWYNLFAQCLKMDSLLADEGVVKSSINYYENDPDNASSLKLTLFLNKGTVCALIYPTFDVVGDFTGYKKVLFNESGKPFATIGSKDSTWHDFTLFDIQSGVFYKDTISEEKGIHFYDSKAYKNAELQCETVRQIENFIHRFPLFGKYSPTRCIDMNKKEDLVLVKDSIILYDEEGLINHKGKSFLRGTRFKYLIADSVNVDGKNPPDYYIKVRVANKKDSGWLLFRNNFLDVNELD